MLANDGLRLARKMVGSSADSAIAAPSESGAPKRNEWDARSAAAALQPQGLRLVAQRLKTRDSSEDHRAWDALMAAAQGGDAAAYHRLLVDVASWLRRYFARRLPPAIVDDAVQDTLIGVHEKRHTYDPARPFGAWLAAIARYKWIDALRSLNAKPTDVLDDDIPIPDHEEAITSIWTLERLLTTLKPSQSQVIRLVKLQGLSIEEASKATGQSASLVKVNIHRGLKRLTSLLRSESDAD
jgi:RNA polymerase sigma factor (sigma-70 family)